MKLNSVIELIASILVGGSCVAEASDRVVTDEWIAGMIVHWARFEDIGNSEHRWLLQQCDHATNRLRQVARELYETNTNNRVRARALTMFWRYGTLQDAPFLNACVLDTKHGEYVLRILQRIEGVCSNSVDQLVRFHQTTDAANEVKLSSDKGVAFRNLASAIQRPSINASLRRYFAESIPTCISNNVSYAWMGDLSLRELDETYQNSRRRLTLLRYALPLQTVERLRAAMSAAIRDLEAYPEANLPE